MEGLTKHMCTCLNKSCVCPLPNPATEDDLPENLGPGTCITLRGFVNGNCMGFGVNLSCNRSPAADIALYLNPCLNMRYVSRNCRIGGEWGEEECTSIQEFELKRSEEFVMNIYLTRREFLVAINGKHFCAFIYRMPLSNIKVIVVHGKVKIHEIKYEKIDIYPPPNPKVVPLQLLLGGKIGQFAPNKNRAEMNTPLRIMLPQKFPDKYQICINGYFKFVSRTFFVRLQEGIHIWPQPNILLYVRAIMNTTFNELIFHTNCMRGSKWGREEQSGIHRFLPSSDFSLVIKHVQDNLSVWKDNLLISEENNVLLIERIAHFEVKKACPVQTEMLPLQKKGSSSTQAHGDDEGHHSTKPENGYSSRGPLETCVTSDGNHSKTDVTLGILDYEKSERPGGPIRIQTNLKKTIIPEFQQEGANNQNQIKNWSEVVKANAESPH
ncbi:hypothetical protein JTB14_035988 [Gonioctena quinquepunctata]|nr:hypothetical protein JTB14_035988 [Gonioctena quinquepunctata]